MSDRPIIAAGAVPGYGAIFNAGVVTHQGRYHLFARGIREGYVRNTGEGARFLDYVSDVLVFVSDDGVDYRFQQVLAQSSDAWIHAVEDPRVQVVHNHGVPEIVMTYTHLSHPSTGLPWRVGAHRLSFDGERFAIDDASGRILGPDGVHDKDAVIFNLRDGRVAFIHRIHPNIQVAVFDSLDHLWDAGADYWDAHMAQLDRHTIIAPSTRAAGVGAGAPPIDTPDGMLLFYHERLHDGTYTANVALLDHTTGQVITILDDPILVPELDWERVGDVDNVIFVCGAVAGENGSVYLTYGAADSCVGAALVDMEELLQALRDQLEDEAA